MEMRNRNNVLAEFVRKRRKQSGLTQIELADKGSKIGRKL